ncbi:hypothetical protein [Devosia sp.]|uniref:hypothetical protein n=1 Tax=Devosia sp. TaxID=1871048 RepID=UPI002F25A3FF
MPLQNRVTPFGDIVAIPERGLFTGNRGIIHDPTTKTLLRRRWASKAWIVCSCSYKGRWRPVMGRRNWTELFFLDEATALAAGHRPCFACRRAAALAFRAAWAAGNGTVPLPVKELDAVLHGERLAGRRKRLHKLAGAWRTLPEGTMLAVGARPYLVAPGGRLLSWTPAGYVAGDVPAAFDGVLTPPSTLAALRAGYRPVLHVSATS